MVPNEFPSLLVCPRGSEGSGSDPRRTVVWMRGEHDTATRSYLSVTLDQAAQLDDADLVVDLSGVTFMDASTISALVGVDRRLRSCSHSLTVRSPSPLARRLLEVCELGFLIDEAPVLSRPTVAPALDSWVAVAATERSHVPPTPPSEHASGQKHPLPATSS